MPRIVLTSAQSPSQQTNLLQRPTPPRQALETLHAVQLLQFLSEVCVSDALLGRTASIPMLVLVERFKQEKLLLDYLEVTIYIYIYINIYIYIYIYIY